jgi:leader peptidase (prepilin peptidase)/N-methyltransferase
VLLLAAGLAGAAYAIYGWAPAALVVLLEAAFFLLIAIIDLEHHLVLNRLLAPALPCCVVASLWLGTVSMRSLGLGALVGLLFYLVVALWLPGALGMGDVKLAGLIGATVGLFNLLVVIYIAILLGGIVAIGIWARTRTLRGRQIAYAPYLVIGAWFVLFHGPALLVQYW